MEIMLRKLIRKAGLNIQKWSDPYKDVARMLDANSLKNLLDGGGYKGAKTSEMLKTFTESNVYCFEPQPTQFTYLCEKFSDEKRCHIVNKALSDSIGELDFYITEDKYTSSTLKPVSEDIKTASKIKASATTMDDFATETAIKGFDFIKLDLQGYELNALKGATEVLKSCQAVLVEVNFQRRYEGCALFHEVTQLLYDSGFYLYKIYDIHGYPNKAWQLGDALFLKQ